MCTGRTLVWAAWGFFISWVIPGSKQIEKNNHKNYPPCFEHDIKAQKYPCWYAHSPLWLQRAHRYMSWLCHTICYSTRNNHKHHTTNRQFRACDFRCCLKRICLHTYRLRWSRYCTPRIIRTPTMNKHVGEILILPNPPHTWATSYCYLCRTSYAYWVKKRGTHHSLNLLPFLSSHL